MKKVIASLIAGSPLLAFAQPVITDIDSAASWATRVGNLIISVAISLAVLWIIVSVVRYLIAGSTNEEARKKGGQSILYGVIGLFVILSIWGLVAILRNSVRTDNRVPVEEIKRTTQLPNPDYVQ